MALERASQQDPHTGGKAYELLVSAFDDAVVAELIDATPCTLRGAGAPDRAREPESLSLHEVDRFLAAVEEPWAKAALTIQVTCGLRIGEVLALRSKDLDLQAETVAVAGTVAKVGDLGTRTRVVQAQRPGHRCAPSRSSPTPSPS